MDLDKMRSHDASGIMNYNNSHEKLRAVWQIVGMTNFMIRVYCSYKSLSLLNIRTIQPWVS